MNSPREIGMIVSGSLSEGLEMRLAVSEPVEEIRAGKFVVIRGQRYQFFSMIINVALGAQNPAILQTPPGPTETLLRTALEGIGTYSTLELRPMLMLKSTGGSEVDGEELLPVKSIPPHFSPVVEATSDDVNRVFGEESSGKHFVIGSPLDMEDASVCLDLERFVERSNAIFGKSGTGKTFLTRLCLCGIIKEKKAVNLVFDMHSEYGWSGTSEGDRTTVRSLKQYFPNQVCVYTMDPDSHKRRGTAVMNTVRIPQSQLTVDDVLLLQRELNLNPTAVETAYLLVNKFNDNWFTALLDMDTQAIKDFAEESGAHPGSLGALKRKLARLKADCPYLVDRTLDKDDSVKAILADLRAGKHVILEFGQYNKPVQYMLAANILTRRLHDAYVRATEESMQNGAAKVMPLVITIEEAHKFLSPALSDQTIFGTIARELRKYNVTLLIVDQRPCGIDDEVLSQVGTRLICLLEDEKDVEAALAGVPGSRALRNVLAGLESKQQALILGHAVPMPVVIKTRTYDDEAFRKAIQMEDDTERNRRVEQESKEFSY